MLHARLAACYTVYTCVCAMVFGDAGVGMGFTRGGGCVLLWSGGDRSGSDVVLRMALIVYL